MAKKQVMISIDAEIHKKAKDKRLNISLECEEHLRKLVSATKKDLPVEVLITTCAICKRPIEWGYFCNQKQKVYCEDCNDMGMKNCLPDKRGEHMHTIWGKNPRFEDEVK